MLIPFALMLLCIALLPYILKRHWERNYHFIAAGLAAIPIAYYIFFLHNPGRLLHEATDYVSFIALVGSLFVVTGGIHFAIIGRGNPAKNSLFLLGGGLLANIIGTTGASVLLIRPWMRLNRGRYLPLHTAFFIFIVGNVGGGMTPIGDPPLLLGYLKGVPFTWIARHCWKPWSLALGSLLVIFFLADTIISRRAHAVAPPDEPEEQPDEFRFDGKRNLWFLAIVLLAVFIDHPRFLRELLMVLAATASYFFTPKKIYRANAFSFHPINEVAWLFFGIFATMVPVLDYVQLHSAAMPLAQPSHYFWITGALSSVLDNAPTYLTFFSTALGRAGGSIENTHDVLKFLDGNSPTLVGIAMGAVIFGALTYIGNGPNFLVKSTVEQHHLHPPGFFAFFFKYALPVFAPVLALVWFFTFR